MARLVPVLVLVAAAGACAEPAPDEHAETSTISQAVVGATIDTADPAVVALVFSNGSVFCTGTLISPRVILTAAHCIDDGAADPGFSAYFGNDTESDDGARVSIVLKQQHLGWTGNLGDGNDVGLLLLGGPQDRELPVLVNTADLVPHIGIDYRVVGFGIHDRITRDLDGKKRTGVMSIARMRGDYLEAEDPETIICQGDSGGPGFITLDGIEYLAGTHSYSTSGCLNPSGDARPDLHYTSFIQPWVQEHDTTCGADGLCARIGCVDDPDCLPCGADGTCASECALPDVDCPTGEVGEICQAASQCMSGICVAWLDDPHSQFCSTECDGDGECPDGMTCESVPSFGNVCYYQGEPPGAAGQDCEEATDCSEYVCADNTCTYACDLGAGAGCTTGFECATHDDGVNYYCWPLPVEDGGCCSSSPGGGAGAGLLVLITLLLRPRRARTP